MEVYVDDETKLTLHGLQQYYVKLKDNEKNRKLFDLLDVLEFNQVFNLEPLLLVMKLIYFGNNKTYIQSQPSQNGPAAGSMNHLLAIRKRIIFTNKKATKPPQTLI